MFSMLKHGVRCARRDRAFAIVGLSIGLCGGASAVMAANSAGFEERMRRLQDRLVPPVLVRGESPATATLAARMAELNVPGVSIAVIHRGRIDGARGFGVASHSGPPVTPDTLFQAASISKPVFALAVLHFVDAKRLNLDANVNEYLRTWKLLENEFTSKAPVTLRGLLTHSAGITVHGFPGYAAETRVPTLVEVLDGVPPANTAAIRVDITPGSRHRYSGGGYEVAQQVLSDVTGEPLPTVLRDTVLLPLGMSNSTFLQPLPDTLRSRVAWPHRRDGSPVRGGPHTYPEMAAAGLWTTPTDLARYAIGVQEALAGRSTVITMATARAMLTPVIENQGLGPQVGGEARRYFTHNGGNEGYRCLLVAYTDGEGAVVMTNGDRGGELMGEVMRTLAHLYEWPDFAPPLRTVAHVEPGRLDRFVGAYRLDDGATLVIRKVKDNLVSHMPGQPPLVLFPATEREFFAKEEDSTLSFTIDAAGAVKAARYQRPGRGGEGSRLDEASAAPLLAAAERTAQRVKEQKPLPGSDDAVRLLLAGFASGTLDYKRMSPRLADLTRQQMSWLHPWFRGLGTLRSLKFHAVEPDGGDQWDATFEKDVVRVQIQFGEDGRIADVGFPPR